MDEVMVMDVPMTIKRPTITRATTKTAPFSLLICFNASLVLCLYVLKTHVANSDPAYQIPDPKLPCVSVWIFGPDTKTNDDSPDISPLCRSECSTRGIQDRTIYQHITKLEIGDVLNHGDLLSRPLSRARGGKGSGVSDSLTSKQREIIKCIGNIFVRVCFVWGNRGRSVVGITGFWIIRIGISVEV
jgi:hypothetical protein